MNIKSNRPLAEASEQLKYQVNHFDMFFEFGSLFGVLQRHGIYATPRDVSPEFAAYMRKRLENLHPQDDTTATHWSEQ